jgi:hypothetical protein
MAVLVWRMVSVWGAATLVLGPPLPPSCGYLLHATTTFLLRTKKLSGRLISARVWKCVYVVFGGCYHAGTTALFAPFGKRTQGGSTDGASQLSLLLQNMFMVRYLLYRSVRLIPFIWYEKWVLFIIGYLKAVDINKCHVWPISKSLLISAGLERPTPLSLV